MPRRREPRLPAPRAPLNGPRMTLGAELKALDHEVLSEWDPVRKIARLPRAIGREIGAALLRLEAHGYLGVAVEMAKRYSVTTEEIALCALDLSTELVSADSKEPMTDDLHAEYRAWLALTGVSLSGRSIRLIQWLRRQFDDGTDPSLISDRVLAGEYNKR